MLKKNDRPDWVKVGSVICWICLAVYIYKLFDYTLFDRVRVRRSFLLDPFWEFRIMMRSRGYWYWGRQILGNIALLVPLGLLLPVMNERFRSVRRILLAGFCTSLSIETLQFITRRGFFELDDLINNTAGVLIGYGLYILLDKILLCRFREQRDTE